MSADFWRVWRLYLLQLALLSAGVIVVFALLYQSFDALGWGAVHNRAGERERHFLDLLYFSTGTFFRIGYGDQVPVGWARLLVGLEAFCNFLLGLAFIAQLAPAAWQHLAQINLRNQLEGFTRSRD
ncbi:potassium channel family protein [Gloeobacter morelensis]|uniref:Two pore domain potassium channel family protein n=1 Tax=Gloeobacter morelensis MG652769 TaxID=2781736 RepID=A0ABY3PQ96_9CYAN|nr:potassium channel family protein [Gloeobacter morelensis]UFP95878.1 two pore domain potassium channel family protein [Gloeobacter morelensis MG652769]